MKRLIIISCLFFFNAYYYNIAVANPDRFSVIRPVDYSMVEGELSPLVIKLNGNIDAVTMPGIKTGL